jgi:hypothetical protein
VLRFPLFAVSRFAADFLAFAGRVLLAVRLVAMLRRICQEHASTARGGGLRKGAAVRAGVRGAWSVDPLPHPGDAPSHVYALRDGRSPEARLTVWISTCRVTAAQQEGDSGTGDISRDRRLAVQNGGG